MTDLQDNAIAAFAGRVLLALGSLLVLGAMAAAMIGLAYWSKHDLPTAPPGAPAAVTPPPSTGSWIG